MRNVFLTILFLSLPYWSTLQELGLNWMQNDLMFNGRNPAAPMTHKFVIGLPDGSGRLYNQSGSLDDWSLNNKISLQSLWEKLDRKPYHVDGGWSVRSIYIGKRFKGVQVGFYHSFDGLVAVEYPKDLIGLFSYGNYGLLSKEPLAQTQALDLKSNFRTSLYQTFALEGAYDVGPKLSIGGALKYLSGISNVTSDVRRFDLDIRDPLLISANEDWTLKSANLVQDLSVDDFNVGTDGSLIGTHSGFALDFGVHYAYENLRVGVQLRDLGSIAWKGTTFSRSGVTAYQGIRVDEFIDFNENVFNQIGDTLKSVIGVKKEASTYNTGVQTRLIIDAQYKLSEKMLLGGGFLYRATPLNPLFKIAASVAYKAGKALNIGTQVAGDNNANVTLGLFGAVHAGPIKLYMHMDHLPALFTPATVNRFAGNIGMSIQIKKIEAKVLEEVN